MAKKIVQDVLPPNKRSIRNIPLPNEKQESRATERKTAIKVKKVAEEREVKPRNSGGKGKWNVFRIMVWTIAIVCILALGYAVSLLFASAKVTITPKSSEQEIDTTINATLAKMDGSLAYTTITLSKESSKEVPASGSEKVEKKAAGTVVIYNNYSTSAQTLIKNTRLETPDGLIFRLQSAVTIPGRTTKAGVTTPGSIKAQITANQTGEKYNVGLADFTITGFKGTDKYSAFSAKSDPSSPIRGGFVGTLKKVSDSDLSLAKVAIESSLKNDLLEMAKTQVPNTHVLFDDAVIYSFDPISQGSTTASTVVLKEKGTIHGILFNRSELSKLLASDSLAKDGKTPDVISEHIESLGAVFKNKSTYDPKTSNIVTFAFQGKTRFVWNIDVNGLKNSLIGKTRSDIQAVINGFPSINTIEVVMRPFLNYKFPKNPDKITVIINNP